MALPPLSSSAEATSSSGALSPKHQAWVSWIDQLVEQQIAHRLAETSGIPSTATSTATLPAASTTEAGSSTAAAVATSTTAGAVGE